MNIYNGDLITLIMHGRYLTVDYLGCVSLKGQDKVKFWENQVFTLHKVPVNKEDMSPITKAYPVVIACGDRYLGINPVTNRVYAKYSANTVNTLESDEVLRIVSPTQNKEIKSGNKVALRNRNGLFVSVDYFTQFVDVKVVNAGDGVGNVLFVVGKVGV